jgi:RimJ/RimL family protein N-acetyltransferase
MACAERVALITLRPAEDRDHAQLYAWRMEPETRRQSFQTGPIADDAHAAWYASVRHDPQQRLFIAEAAGGPMGMGRLDWRAGRCKISYSLDPDWRGLGCGTQLIVALTRIAEALGHLRCVAEVKAGNIASLRALERAGYRIQETVIEMEYGRAP